MNDCCEQTTRKADRQLAKGPQFLSPEKIAERNRLARSQVAWARFEEEKCNDLPFCTSEGRRWVKRRKPRFATCIRQQRLNRFRLVFDCRRAKKPPNDREVTRTSFQLLQMNEVSLYTMLSRQHA